MRSITAFTLGVLSSAGLGAAALWAPAALGGDPCPPAAGAAAAPVVPAAAAAPAVPTKEAALAQPFLTSLVGDWACTCDFPTGDKAEGGAHARLVMDGTALLTEATLQWKGPDGKVDPLHSLGLWKVAADGKTVSYWGFSSHDSQADMLTGEATADSATVAGMTRWGPMRLTLSQKDGVLSQQLWINAKDMGLVKYTKAGAAPAGGDAAAPAGQ